jgi:hypothetical protein
VIPEGFHQPMTDYRNDARITAKLLREMEEELFGRTDIDNTPTQPSAATRASRPLVRADAMARGKPGTLKWNAQDSD